MSKFLRLPDVLARLDNTISRATLYRLVQAGDFPAPRKLTPRVSVWLTSEVDAWVSERLGD